MESPIGVQVLKKHLGMDMSALRLSTRNLFVYYKFRQPGKRLTEHLGWPIVYATSVRKSGLSHSFHKIGLYVARLRFDRLASRIYCDQRTNKRGRVISIELNH